MPDLEKGQSEAKECNVRHKDGHDVSVIKNASVVKNEDGEVIGIVETVTDMTELMRARKKAEEAVFRLGEIHRMDNIIGKSRAMQKVFEAIRAAAASEATILIQGDSGTGKELVAGAIHFNSDRREGPLVAVNCSALSENLLESELFGHVKGSFTGANRDRKGRFEESSGGTIFLDEIGELSPYIQVKLLRVLQEREVERVGDSRRHKIDIRIITATHKDLYARVREGLFREDLYYRLKVFPIHLPPLRERREDIPILADYFIKRMNKKTGKPITGLSTAAMRVFMDHPWPGNVRELENAIEHAFVLCNRKEIDTVDLPVEIRQPDPSGNLLRGPARKDSAAQETNPSGVDSTSGGVRLEQGRGGSARWPEPDSHMEVYEKVGYPSSTRRIALGVKSPACQPRWCCNSICLRSARIHSAREGQMRSVERGPIHPPAQSRDRSEISR